jgi:hypothetical protein
LAPGRLKFCLSGRPLAGSRGGGDAVDAAQTSTLHLAPLKIKCCAFRVVS